MSSDLPLCIIYHSSLLPFLILFIVIYATLGGPPTGLGETVSMQDAEDRIFGLVLMNDWYETLESIAIEQSTRAQ